MACAAPSTDRPEPAAPAEPPPPTTALVQVPARPGECINGYRFTEHQRDPESERATGADATTELEVGLPLMKHPPNDRELTRFVTADITRGVRLIDVRDPKAPAVKQLVALDGHPEDLRVTDDRALVVASRRERDDTNELLWLSLSATTASPVLQRKVLPAVRSVFELRSTETSMTVVVVTDERHLAPECISRTGTTLRQLELRDDGIFETATRDLGAAVDAVRRSGDWLLVQESTQYRPDTARLVRIRNGSSDLGLSDRFEVHGPIKGFHADAQGPRIVTTEHGGNAERPHTMLGSARVETLRVSESGAIERIAACERTRSSVPQRQSAALADSLFVERAAFTADRTLLLVHEHVGAADRIAIVDSKTCAATRFPGGVVLGAPDEPASMLAAEISGPKLDVRLYDAERATAQNPGARAVLHTSRMPRDSLYRGYSAYLPHEARVHVAGPYAWLAAPFRELDAQSVLHAGTQLFALKKTGPVLGPKLDGVLWLIDEHGRAVFRSPTGLRIIQLHDGSAPEVIADLNLWHGYNHGVLIGDATGSATQPRMIARLRSSAEPPTYDPHTDAPMAQLEIVDGHDDPHFGPALARFPVSGNASLHSTGKLVVAISQATRGVEPDPRGPCHITVIDTAVKPAPAKIAFYDDKGPCTAHSLAEKHPELASLRPEPFPATGLDTAAYPDARTFPDETLLDVRDDELLLLRYGSLRRTPRNKP